MDERYSYLPANCIIKPPSPQNIVVQQVIGQKDVQKVIDIRLVVPKHKPAIEQVIDVLVKNLCITNVEVIPHKVIVRGHFELKALYVACLPSQPVHAVEARHVRFTAAAHIHGCTYGADADAHATVEFIDYSTRKSHRLRKLRPSYKTPAWKKPKKHHKDDCDCTPDWHDDWHDECHDHSGHDHDCHDHHDHDCHDHHKPDCHDDCKPCKPKPKPCKPSRGCREINATVIIRIRVKVLTDRKILLHPGFHAPDAHHMPIGQLPHKPKG